MMTMAVFFFGLLIGYGVRVVYFLATGRDIPIYTARDEVRRLRREADRIAARINPPQ